MVARNVTDLQILLPMKCPAERTILTHCRHMNLACKWLQGKENCNFFLIFIVGAIWIEIAVLIVLKYMIETSLVQQLSKVCN